MRFVLLLPLVVCSIYVFSSAIVAILMILEGIATGTPHSVVGGVGAVALTAPLAILQILAVFYRIARAAAVVSFFFFAFFLVSLAVIAVNWPGLPQRPESPDGLGWGILIAATAMNLLTALVMAAFSERCKTTSTHQPQIRDAAVGEAFLRVARKMELPPYIRNLRRASWFMVGLSSFFYIVGNNALRGHAVMGFIAGAIGIGASYLIDRMDHHANLQ